MIQSEALTKLLRSLMHLHQHERNILYGLHIALNPSKTKMTMHSQNNRGIIFTKSHIIIPKVFNQNCYYFPTQLHSIFPFQF